MMELQRVIWQPFCLCFSLLSLGSFLLLVRDLPFSQRHLSNWGPTLPFWLSSIYFLIVLLASSSLIFEYCFRCIYEVKYRLIIHTGFHEFLLLSKISYVCSLKILKWEKLSSFCFKNSCNWWVKNVYQSNQCESKCHVRSSP